jgi:signal transduction histidine kinase
MLPSATDWIDLLSRAATDAERLPADAAGRAACLAGAARTSWPGASFYACLLLCRGARHLAVLDAGGALQAGWAAPLGAWFAAPPAGSITFDAPGWPFTGHRVASEPLAADGAGHGLLAVGVPPAAGAAELAARGGMLRLLARHAALRLDLERCHGELARLRELAVGEGGPAELGALASPLVHAVNNFLNVVSLQLAVMARLVPEATGAELASIRQNGKALAALVQEWLRSRSRSRPAPERADLNRLVEEAVGSLAAEGAAPGASAVRLAGGADGPPDAIAVHLALGDGLPPVEGSPVDVLLLVRLLVADAAATLTSAAGSVTVRTAAGPDHVLLRVEDTGPGIAGEVLPRVFDTTTAAREGSGRLELAACESLVRRRLQGAILVENRDGGGVAVEARLRPAPSGG